MAPQVTKPVSAPDPQTDENTQEIKTLRRDVEQTQRDLRKLAAKEARDKIRSDKKAYALASMLSWTHTIMVKVDALMDAADRISGAYAHACKKHRDAILAAQKEEEQEEALEAQLMFSILTVVCSGALSWVGNIAATKVATVSGKKLGVQIEVDSVIDSMKSRSPGLQGPLSMVSRNYAAALTRKLDLKGMLMGTFRDMVQAAVGEGLSAMGPFYTAQLWPKNVADPLDIEPEEFHDSLNEHVHGLMAPPLAFLSQVSAEIKRAMDPKLDARWDSFNIDTFDSAWDDWQKKLDQFAIVPDLPDDGDMKKEMERYIWAVWILSTGLKQDTEACVDGEGPRHPKICVTEKNGAWVRIRKPIDDRYVALGIETSAQTDLSRDKEDPLLINWAKDYVANMKPWVTKAMMDTTGG